MPATRIAEVLATLDQTGRLETKSIHGSILGLTGPAGEPLLFVYASASGPSGAVSNDHYPYHEFVFAAPAAGPPQLLAFQRFYYDVAGMEGWEWPVLFRVFAVGLLILVIPLAALPSVRSPAKRSRSRRMCGFPVVEPGVSSA